MIEADFTLSFRDYRAALGLFRRHHWRALTVFVILCVLLPLVFVGLFAVSWRSAGPDGLKAGHFINLVFAPVNPLLYLWTQRRCYRRMFLNADTKLVHFGADESGLHFRLPTGVESRYPWAAVKRWYENARSAVFAISKTQFLLLPRHALSEAQWAEFRELVKAHMRAPGAETVPGD